LFSIPDIFQAGSSPVSSISGFSVGSGRVDEAVDDFKVGFKLEFLRRLSNNCLIRLVFLEKN